jgi:hypothetical protein
MQLAFYTALKARIETLTSLKIVGLWNNQYARENENVSFGYPNVFIEFADVTYTEILNGVQRYDMTVNLHLGFESYKTEDTDILQLKQDLQAIVHYFQQGYNTKMLRRSETQNFDHDNVQEYIISYAVSGKDFSISTAPTTEATVTILNTIVEPIVTNNTIMTASPVIP